MPYLVLLAVLLFVVYSLGPFFVALFVVSVVLFSIWPRHTHEQNTPTAPQKTEQPAATTDPAPLFVVTWDTLDPLNINRIQHHAKSYGTHEAAKREQQKHRHAQIRIPTT